MKIAEIKTYLMQAAKGHDAWSQRNWLFVKVITDEGIYGVGEASGWPRVVETAIRDLSAILIGDDPFRIERICQKIMTAMMGHGMTGVVGSGAMTGIEMALWDLKGKALGVPVYELLGGRIRDEVQLYAHAGTPERNEELVSMGYGALKTGGTDGLPAKVARLRAALGPDVDLMVDVHGPPWLTTRDAIALGQRLEEYDLLFYEDPVAPENIEGIRRVAESVNIPIGGRRAPLIPLGRSAAPGRGDRRRHPAGHRTCRRPAAAQEDRGAGGSALRRHRAARRVARAGRGDGRRARAGDGPELPPARALGRRRARPL